MEFSTRAGTAESLKGQCLLVFAEAGGKLGAAARAIDARHNGVIAAAIKRGDITGKSGQAHLLADGATRVVVVGLGKTAEMGEAGWLKALRAGVDVTLATPAGTPARWHRRFWPRPTEPTNSRASAKTRPSWARCMSGRQTKPRCCWPSAACARVRRLAPVRVARANSAISPAMSARRVTSPIRPATWPRRSTSRRRFTTKRTSRSWAWARSCRCHVGAPNRPDSSSCVTRAPRKTRPRWP
ncbi:MAG: hypothetical protein EBT40_04425 [Betaproteobacteria bacterium]|nr:hypothetical protein [Betaproteobacteria bacterium]